jgi:hypothetical protein
MVGNHKIDTILDRKFSGLRRQGQAGCDTPEVPLGIPQQKPGIIPLCG